jgi:hypothetical protein
MQEETGRLIKLIQSQPKSAQTYIDLLRAVIDTAHNDKLLYLEISYKKQGDPVMHSISIVS